MTKEEHKQLHVELHRNLDLLLSDYFIHNKGKLVKDVTLLDLAKWTYEQTIDPTELEVA